MLPLTIACPIVPIARQAGPIVSICNRLLMGFDMTSGRHIYSNMFCRINLFDLVTLVILELSKLKTSDTNLRNLRLLNLTSWCLLGF